MDMVTKTEIDLKAWKNARAIIKAQLMADPDLRHAYQCNIAMLLSDHYEIKDHVLRNQAADDIIKLVFEDKYY